MQERILLSPPDVGNDEREALLRAFDGGWVAPVGPELDAFEAELADYLSAEDVAAVSSGTAALHLGLLGLGVRPGDEVVVQSATFAATAFSVVHAGARPVFCDIDRDTWAMDPHRLEELLARKANAGQLPAAVVTVDLYGLCANYATIREICGRYEIPLLEDAAEALGSVASGGEMAGTLGDLGVVSFNGNKIMTTSGGGALVGPTEQIEAARYLATQAREPVLHYEHRAIGFNYRMSNLLAGLGRAQLSGLEPRLARRLEIRETYIRAFPGLGFLDSVATTRMNAWLSVCLLPDDLHPIDVCEALESMDIEARPTWKPMHLQPVFANAESDSGDVSEELFRRGICLPSGSNLTVADQDRVISALTNCLRKELTTL